MTAARPPIAYRWRLVMLTPLLVAYTLWRGFKERSGRYILQRIGFAYPQCDGSVWVHCASVGELNTAIPLIKQLQQQYSETRFVITSNTNTSAEVFKNHALARATHCFLPLDGSWITRRFIKAIRPRIAIILETELWPNLFSATAANQIPIVVVNARLSSRTTQVTQPWLLAAYRFCLANVSTVLARNKSDAAGYIELGADRAIVQVVGNLKFAAAAAPTESILRLVAREYVLAASTHGDEEVQLADAWQQSAPERLLVIAPRHPHRGDTLAKQLRGRGWNVAQRSKQETIEHHTGIYLADTVGELQQLIAYAQWVFIGGSLIPRGGQNLLEPARAGKAIVCGLHMENFADEMRILIESGGAIQVGSEGELRAAITKLGDDNVRKKMGDRAKLVCTDNSNIAAQYSELIAARIN